MSDNEKRLFGDQFDETRSSKVKRRRTRLSGQWDDWDSGVTAWMYDYDEIRERDIVVAEIEP